ncbi:alpha/beta fold hydrolase [Helicobacter canis]|uniref:acylphosphatase n=1 Tax=Helicobacter canis TaxID=29419 RepID=A0A377J675_9HELI|nr:2-hydroxy-6-oxohepta-2,4-dienoate hydrolase [Helicobacter canis]
MASRRITYLGQSLEIAYIKHKPNAASTSNIVFLHGWGSHKELMLQAFGGSFADYTHYYIDLPGFGASSYGELESTFDTSAVRGQMDSSLSRKAESPKVQKVDSSMPDTQAVRILDTNDYAHIVLAFLRALRVRADIIVGHSFGGKVAVLCAAIEKVDSRNEAMDCHATATQCLAMTEKNAVSEKVDSRGNAENVEKTQNEKVEVVFDKTPQNTGAKNVFNKQATSGRIFDEKVGLCSGEQGDKTWVSIDAASHKLPAFSQKANAKTNNEDSSIGDIILLSSAGIIYPKPLKVRVKIACAKIAKALHLRLPFLRANDAKTLNPTMYEIFKRVVDEDFSPIFAACRHNVSIFWGRDDKATPLESGQQIHALIPSSRLFALEGDHYFFINQTARIESMYHTKAWHIRVFGKVQGVGYRKFAKAKADELGLQGSAQNLLDGSVEIFACGDESVAARFLQALWVGPSRAQVQEVQSQPCALKQEWLDRSAFEILT